MKLLRRSQRNILIRDLGARYPVPKIENRVIYSRDLIYQKIRIKLSVNAKFHSPGLLCWYQINVICLKSGAESLF